MAGFLRNFVACLLTIGVLGTCDYSVPIVTRLEVVDNNGFRHYSLQYLSNQKPDILWQVSSFLQLHDTTNAFDGLEGESSVRVNMTYYARYSSLEVESHLYTSDFEMKVNFKENISASSQPRSNLVRPIHFTAERSGEITFEKGEVITFNLTLESQNLGQFQNANAWGSLMSLDYKSVPYSPTYRRDVPYRLRGQFARENALVIPEINITSSSASASTSVTIDTSFDYVEGQLTVGVWFRPGETVDLISSISLRRRMWLKESGHDAPFRRFVNFYRNEDNNKRSDVLAPSTAYMEFSAIGNPEPDISMFKDCQVVDEAVSEKLVIRHPYSLRVLYFFNNVSSDLGGSYYVKATNGDDTVSKQNYVTVL